MKRGKFIVLEGLDGSGKATHTRLLGDYLKEKVGEEKLLIASFPRYYSSVFGKLVGDFLSGKFGKLSEVSPYLSALTFMLDEYTWSRDICRPWLEKGGWVLCDRYVTSNVHQIARLNTKAKSDFRSWFWNVVYSELKIIEPDLVVFLDRSPIDSMKLIKRKDGRGYLKGKKRDIAERDRSHQEAAYREYLREVKRKKNWTSISCETNESLGGDTPIIQERIRHLVAKKYFE